MLIYWQMIKLVKSNFTDKVQSLFLFLLHAVKSAFLSCDLFTGGKYGIVAFIVCCEISEMNICFVTALYQDFIPELFIAVACCECSCRP